MLDTEIVVVNSTRPEPDVIARAASVRRDGGLVAFPTETAYGLRGDMVGRIDMTLDGGPSPGGLESTVLDLTCTPPRLLRPGLVTPDQIEAIIGPINLATTQTAASDAPLPSPGMLGRHYAPRAPLELADDDGWKLVEAHCRAERSVGWLTWARAPTEWPALA